MDEAKLQAQLEEQVEVLRRWLDKAEPSNRPLYRQAVRKKQLLERELKLSKLRETLSKAKGEHGPNPSNERQKFIVPILETKGLSIHDWANQAGVDWHTADNYLSGKARPYRSTRGKLAHALGVKVEDLPA